MTEKKEKMMKIASIIVLSSFILPIGFLIFRIIFPEMYVDESSRTRSDYVLMLIQCILGVVVLLYPKMFFKKRQITIPSNLYFLYMIFLFCAIFLGEVRNFYYVFPHWDLILHTFSGGMIAALGFSFATLLNDEENIHLKLSPFFCWIFCIYFCYNIRCYLGSVWVCSWWTFRFEYAKIRIRRWHAINW